MQSGSISIHAQNIMPIIKRWLYSDKDIFIREMVSNGCDAITKYRMLHPGCQEDLRVTVTVNEPEGTIAFEDNGIGMTWDEVEKYINQVAFSSAEEFLKNYEGEDKGGIIGHFGLGFYSAFMAASRVVIDTRSWQEGAAPVRWESEDGMRFTMSEGSRPARGTRITLTILEEEKEFLKLYRVREVLDRYCGYLATPVYLVDAAAKAEPADDETPAPDAAQAGEGAAPSEPQPINDTHPLWLKPPRECGEDEYKALYHKLFHAFDDPLFWIHLNVEYPFNLKGILYFPKIRKDFGGQEGQIKLFSGQVFVADNIKEVIPEFLMLLKGVIDCPDLPLNVSRSFLQNDGYVKKLSAHITKKVADKLLSLFNTERKTYETYWDDIHPFIKYGCIRDAKFYEAVKGCLLYKTTAGEYLTLEEYRARNEGKAEKKIYYTTEPERQAASVKLYADRGIDVAVMDTMIDLNFMSFMEYGGGEEGLSFARVDADVSGLTAQDGEGAALDAEALAGRVKKALGKEEMDVKLEALADENLPAMLVEEEQSRRFRELSRAYGESFNLPERYTLVLNSRCKTVQALAAMPEGETADLLCQSLFDLSRMASRPLESEDLSAFLSRSQKLLALLAARA